MTLPQASAVPITNKGSLETITLKNLVALDLIESNENLLKAFRLFDDSKTKISLGDKLTKEQIQNLIKQKQDEINTQQDELKTLKHQITHDMDKDNQLINSLASEFLNDEIAQDDTDQLIAEFEEINGVKVQFNENGDHFKEFSLDLGINAATKPKDESTDGQIPEQSSQPFPPSSNATIQVPTSAPETTTINNDTTQPPSEQAASQQYNDTVMEE
ncbi:unnamed protein product [Wickerhamomyces anomalus]